MSQTRKDMELIEKLRKHPKLFARVEALVGIIENAGGDVKKAWEAEMRVIEEVRQLGNDTLRSWAAEQAKQSAQEMEGKAGVWRSGKKNCAGTVPSESLK